MITSEIDWFSKFSMTLLSPFETQSVQKLSAVSAVSSERLIVNTNKSGLTLLSFDFAKKTDHVITSNWTGETENISTL